MILYFSGMGNTRHVAGLLARRIADDDLREMTASMLLDPASVSIEIGSDDRRIIWAFPTYSWGIPPVVAGVMKYVRLGANALTAAHVMLTTCGDDMGCVDRQWRRIMHARGLHTEGAYSVIMPNTYTFMKGFDVDSAVLAREKVKVSAEAVDRIAEAIGEGRGNILVRGSFHRFKTAVIYPWFKRFAMSPKPFHSTEGCVGCGKCAASCPMKNITMAEGRPLWGTHCAFCLRCYHICPHHAVAYGRATDGKGQWIFC